MGIKRVIVICLIISFALCSYVILAHKYNPMGVELNFRGNIDKDKFNGIKKSIHLGEYSINYSMPYKKDMLIMTTGMDRQFIDMDIIHGQFISESDNKVAVIGDRIADKYFKTENVLGKELDIFEEEYEILGVIKNSNNIYISYDESLIELDWKKKSIKYQIKYDELFYNTIKKVEGQLRNLGIEVYDTIVYKEKINGYRNIIIVVTIYVLLVYILKLFKLFKADCFKIWKLYNQQRRVIEWYMFLKNNIKFVASILAKAIGIALMGFSIFKIKSFIYISEIHIPDNLFSPSSYMEVIEVKYNQLFLRLQNGFSDVLVDTVIINIIFIAALIIASTIMNKILSNFKEINRQNK